MGISYKKLKEIQNRQITEMSRMTPEHVKLYDEISTIARHTPADERTQEEWILSAGKAIVQAQRDNKPARELYGPDLEQDIHAQLGITDTAPKKNASVAEPQATENAEPAKRTPKWYAMIAWAALSFVLLIQGCAGLFMGWTGGDTEPFQHISLFSLIVAAVGGIALVEMLRRLAERPDDEGADRNKVPKINIGGSSSTSRSWYSCCLSGIRYVINFRYLH